jgi:hypothetical protein
VRQESKTHSDEVRNHNRQEMMALAERIGEVDNLIEEAVKDMVPGV